MGCGNRAYLHVSLGVESTVLFPFMFGKAASHVVVFAGPPQVTHFLIVCHHGHVCLFLWFRQGVRFL